jgi:membrane fusion protein (multidrug efflux system)
MTTLKVRSKGPASPLSRRGRSGVIAGILALGLMLVAASQASAETFTFEGRIEAYKRAELSSQLDGIIAEVLFTGGERVAAGAPLIVLDPSDVDLAIAQAGSALTRFQAELDLAEQDVLRMRELGVSRVATPAKVEAAEAAFLIAKANLASAKTAIAKARLDRERTVIRAPIDGVAGRPSTVVGAFVEAESGSPLGEIIQLDPVLVSYRVPYTTRLETIDKTGAASIEAMFERIALELQVPGGMTYAHQADPQFASATLDPDDGTINVWASVPNPDGLLRPGLGVIVHSSIIDPVE